MPIIKYEKGNLLECSYPIIAHGVNTLGVMGAGIALSIKEKWPESFNKYKEYVDNSKGNLLGIALSTYEKENKKIIFHMFTQDDVTHGTRNVNYGALARAFSEVNNSLHTMQAFDRHMEKEMTGKDVDIPIPTLAIPKIGAGLGDGDWNIIKEIINVCTPDIAVIVFEL